jgi:hypothetical protein
MSVGPTPSLNFIGDTVDDTPPHSMSEMRGIRFASGNSPITGSISLGNFRNQTLTTSWLEKSKVGLGNSSASISRDGNTAIVGNYAGKGAAYIFTSSGTSWSQQAKIEASDGQQNDRFGESVSISKDGNTVIVGAKYATSKAAYAGKAYIFTRSGTSWSEQAKIEASDGQKDDNFGSSVSISGDGNTAIVGANHYDGDPSVGIYNSGAAYIFTRSGTSWSEQAKIEASDKQNFDLFGVSVSISGDGNTAIVAGTNAGSVYIFTRTGTSWSEQANIQTLREEVVSISDDGNTAIVGMVGAIASTGEAYIFTRSGTSWSKQATIYASDKQQYDNFGWSVSISGDGNTAIVGAFTEDTGAYAAGSAYIFTRTGTSWSEKKKIQASNRRRDGLFGDSVSNSEDGNIAIVTSPSDAYFFYNDYYI